MVDHKGPGGPDDLFGPGPVAAGPEDSEEAARDSFAEMVFDAVDRLRAELGEPYASRIGEIGIITEDEALPGEAPPGTILFALHRGVALTREHADIALDRPTIRIFRRPHEWRFPDPAARELAVEDTVLHEVGHHLGFDETRIQGIEQGRRARGRSWR